MYVCVYWGPMRAHLTSLKSLCRIKCWGAVAAARVCAREEPLERPRASLDSELGVGSLARRLKEALNDQKNMRERKKYV